VNLSNLISKVTKTVSSNSPEILTALGVSGVVVTAYLAAKASFKASRLIDAKEDTEGISDNQKERLKVRTKLVWKEYVPAGIAGGLTVCCIVGASKANGRRTAAAVTAYSLTEKAFSEYKEKVVEQIGVGKEQKIRDELAQQSVDRKSPTVKEIVPIGPGYVLCCELFTGRYFRSNMETLRKAQNDIGFKIVNDIYVTLTEFYDLIDLPSTSTSDKIGWDSDKKMELVFSTTMTSTGEPCLAFDYNYTKPLK
jgi:hypothetical protein